MNIHDALALYQAARMHMTEHEQEGARTRINRRLRSGRSDG
jgi:hypothetical protein